MKSAILAAVFVLFAFSILSISVSAENKYMNFYSSSVVQPGQKINFTGSVYNSSNTSQIMPNINMSAIINGTVNSSATSSGSQSAFTVNAPNAVGAYSMTIYSNDTSIMNKTFTVYVSNVSGGSITFSGKYPPFSAGSTFTINVTLKNVTSSSAITAIANYLPNISVFSTNGGQAPWTITNLSAASDSAGSMLFNITVPSDASGQYVIVAEYGVLYKVFGISSGYLIAADTEDLSGAVSTNFAQGSTVNIMAKVRDSSGNPVTSSQISNITAFITLPNSTVINKTLSVLNDSAYPGYYNYTIVLGNSSQDIGQENIRIVAGIGGKLIDASAPLNVKVFTVKLEMQKEFFEDWGGQAAFKVGQSASLNIIPINLSDSSIISPGSAGLSACDNNSLQLVDVFYANGTSINNTMGSATFGNGRSMATTVCKISFTAPANSGTYGMRVNVTVSNITVTGETYFSAQKVMMKASPVSGIGGNDDFMTMASPGDNITIKLSAYNLSNKLSLNGLNITNITVTKITPLQFRSGSSDVGNLTQGNNYTVTDGTDSSNPSVSVTVPSSVMGPTLVEIRANVSGEIVTGSAFFVSNYLAGFIMPQSAGGGMGGGPDSGGGPGGMGGAPFSSCTGTITFSGMVNEVKSSSAAQGVAISSIIQAREELTGKDVSQYLNLGGSTTSASNGTISANITFGGYGFSGFYFMLLNASYQGKTAGLPAGFMCKRLNFWPQTTSAGGTQQSWRIAPNGGVNVTISSATRLNDSAKISNRSYVQLPHVMNFNPSKGGMNLLLPLNSTALNYSFSAADASGNYSNITSNTVSFTIYPWNFSLNGKTLTSWPSGFIDLQPVVTSADIGGLSDVGMGGFQVVPFDAYTQWGGNNQISAGQNVNYTVYAKTNVSLVQGFSVTVGRPWQGQMTNVSNLWYNNTQNISDTQVWFVNFTIPSTMQKGDADISIEANNTNGDKSAAHIWATIVKYSVLIPVEEGISNWDYWSVPVNDSGTSFQGNASSLGWNMTYLRLAYNVGSRTGNWGFGNLWNGSVMIKNQFNGTRYGMPGQQLAVVYNSSTRVLLLDNATQGIYDTLILNNSNGNIWNITIVNLNSRNFSVPNGNGGLYLWSIDGTYVKMVNTSTASSSNGNWGGSYQKNTNFRIPYVVTLSGSAVSGATLSVNSIGKQQDGGGNGGFGFSSSLASGLNYASSSSATDANGFAFVTANISSAGKFMMFWKVLNGGDSDTASMSSGTQVEAKAFQTNGGLAWNSVRNTVTLEKNLTTNIRNAFGDVQYVYNGTVAKVGANDFVRNGNPSETWFIVYNPFTNQTKIGTAPDLSGTQAYTINQSTQIPGGGIQMAVNKLIMNTSSTGNLTMQFYEDSNVGLSNFAMVSSAAPAQNVTVKVCANSFDKPQSKPKEGATFYLYVNAWSAMGPPQQQNLTMIDLNGTVYTAGSLPVIGPKGCLALNVTPAGSQLAGGRWLNGDNQIQGNVMFGTDTEAVWAGEVFYNNWY